MNIIKFIIKNPSILFPIFIILWIIFNFYLGIKGEKDRKRMKIMEKRRKLIGRKSMKEVKYG